MPPYLDQKPYGDYLTDSLQDPSSLPLPRRIPLHRPGRWHSGQPGRLRGAQLAQGQPRAFFCYVPNASLDNTFQSTYLAEESPGYDVATDPNFVMK